jgi:ribosome assembly protein 1
MDRLITEVKMSSLEAYRHINKILEQINAITSTFLTAEAMERAAASTDDDSNKKKYAVAMDERKQLIFSPDRGNVIFVSALDGWAFGIPQWATLFSNKLGMKASSLQRALWGEHYYNPKTKMVATKPATANSKPMFVSMVLDTIWQLYQTVVTDENIPAMNKFITNLQLKIPARDIAAANDMRGKLQAIMRRWLPIPACVLSMVVQHLPSPVEAQAYRMLKFWPGKINPLFIFALSECRCNN